MVVHEAKKTAEKRLFNSSMCVAPQHESHLTCQAHGHDDLVCFKVAWSAGRSTSCAELDKV